LPFSGYANAIDAFLGSHRANFWIFLDVQVVAALSLALK
jgi:hypothetical protein